MTAGKKKLFLVKNYALFLYVLVIAGAAAFSLNKPVYNWDILPYMGVVLSYGNDDIKTIHKEVYAIARVLVPATAYSRTIDSSNVYRNGVAKSPALFRSQFPFYVVKPLYTRLAWLFYKAGVSLPQATVWPSAVAYFFTGLLLFRWVKKYWPEGYACAGCALLMLSPPLLTAAGLSTPDALSGLLLFTAIYFLIEKKSIAGTLVFLFLSVFARLDNIIPAACLLAAIFTGKWTNQMPAAKMLIVSGIFLIACFAVSASVRNFGWSIFYYPIFIKHLNRSYAANDVFVFKEYAALVKSQLVTGLFFSSICPFFFLVLLLLRNNAAFSFYRLSIEQAVAGLFVLIVAMRFILQPLIADRLYIPYYLTVPVFLLKKYSSPVKLLQT